MINLPPARLIPVQILEMPPIFYQLDFLLAWQWELWEKDDPEAKRAADSITMKIVEAESQALRCPN